MKLITYQSQAVLDILKSNELYKAKPSISFKLPYGALIDMLELDCECPIFAVVKGRKQKSAGRISSSVKLFLDVPDEYVYLTEFSVWADFMYCAQFTVRGDYKKLNPSSEEVNNRDYQGLIKRLQQQLPVEKYLFPQAILEHIDPKWLVKHKVLGHKGKGIDFKEKIINIFR